MILQHQQMYETITTTTLTYGEELAIYVPHRSVAFHVDNDLNQTTTIQILGYNWNSGSWENVGSSFTVAASGHEVRTLTPESSGLYVQYQVSAQCTVAPTSGTLDVKTYVDLGD